MLKLQEWNLGKKKTCISSLFWNILYTLRQVTESYKDHNVTLVGPLVHKYHDSAHKKSRRKLQNLSLNYPEKVQIRSKSRWVLFAINNFQHDRVLIS